MEKNLLNNANENENKDLNDKEKKLFSSLNEMKSSTISDRTTQDSLTFPIHSNKEDEKDLKNASLNESHVPQIPLTKKTILTCLKNKKTAMILQKILLEASKDIIDTIVKELSGNYRNLIKDKNGNYFCTDLFKICDQNQRIKILRELSETLADDCMDKCATHPIQTLIDYSTCEEEYKQILSSFNSSQKLYYVSFDSYGNYVVQKIIEHIPEKFRKNFNYLFIFSTPYLTLKQYGVNCCKRFIEHTKNEELIDLLINIVKKDFLKIATHNYGNFLIQELLKKYNNQTQGKNLKRDIIYNYKALSANKYSIYIVDLFLKIASMEEKKEVMVIHNLNSINLNLNQNLNNQNQIMKNNINLGLQNFGEIQNNNSNNNPITSFIGNFNNYNMNNISNINNMSNINNTNMNNGINIGTMNNINNRNNINNISNTSNMLNINNLPFSLHNFKKNNDDGLGKKNV